jgi:hypothetical protein
LGGDKTANQRARNESAEQWARAGLHGSLCSVEMPKAKAANLHTRNLKSGTARLVWFVPRLRAVHLQLAFEHHIIVITK